MNANERLPAGWVVNSKEEAKLIKDALCKTQSDADVCNIPIWLAKNFLESTDVPRFKRILEEAILRKAQENG